MATIKVAVRCRPFVKDDKLGVFLLQVFFASYNLNLKLIRSSLTLPFNFSPTNIVQLTLPIFTPDPIFLKYNILHSHNNL